MEKKSERSNRNIYFTVFIANLPFFVVGYSTGWSSPSIPIITSPDFYMKVTTDQASWMTSLLPLGGFFGPLVSGTLLDIVGRKWTITVNMVLALLGWIVLGCAWSVEMLYIGRFICGVTLAITFTTVPIYIAEISEGANIRKTLEVLYVLPVTYAEPERSFSTLKRLKTWLRATTTGARLNGLPLLNIHREIKLNPEDVPRMRSFFNNLGLVSRCLTILFQFAVGPFVSYLTLILLSCIFPVLYFFLMFWLPESPYFLVAKGRKEEAEKLLAWLRGGMPENMLQKEIIEIQAYIQKSTSQKSSYKDLFEKKYRRVLFITFGVLSYFQLVGSSVVLYYFQPIFKATGSTLSYSLSAVLAGLAMASVSFAVPIVAQRFGYRKSMIVSSAGLGICLSILGGCFAFSERGIHFPGLNYLPVICMLSYIVMLTLGMMNQPWALVGEILPSNIKAKVSAVACSFSFLIGFLTTITFSPITNAVGTDFGFWLYAFLCFTSVMFITVFVPETKGLTLSEIQDVIKLPRRIDQNSNSKEQDVIGYLKKNHYEINAGTKGTYKSITKNELNLNVRELII